ncbi:archaemetzincin-1 isoform X1 [Bubalus kerabau]|uniref:archaemetzincin-1 isoform X1 n=1 Tax=Bubalus carabanensis TaxID=3119969 RepID=UPI00244F021E|nr:archaemetzincin-1 isoform X1 [Bubalus carabanensis]
MSCPGEARPIMLQCRPAEEFSFGPRALKDALLSTDPALQQLYAAAFSPAERLFLAEAYNPQRTLFGTLLIRTAFDWLLSRPEAPEDFQTFHAALPPRKQSLARKHIYLQPIGLSEGPAGSALLDQLRSCTEAFFLGLQVRCLPSVAAASIHCSSRPGQDPDRLQLHTDGILSFLKSSKPGDALCVLGLTLSDLYPHEAWTFTFGTFLPGHEVGVCSFARFSGEFLPRGPSTPDLAEVEAAADGPEVPLQDGGQAVCFSALGMVQCCKVTCHELCHLLGLGNCRWLRCLMQGALRVDEALRRPLDLCPICLRKLQHLLGFRLVDRYKRLYAWTQAAAGTQPSPAAVGEPSVSEDTLPCSADSGLCCESDSEPGSSLSEPLSPDAWSQAFPAGLELDAEDGLGSLAAAEGLGEALAEHGRWLAACIQALEREVSERELERVDGAVDALAPWDLFTGRLPAPRQDPPCGRDGAGLRRVLGDTFSSLRRRLSARRPSRAESSPRRQKAEDD